MAAMRSAAAAAVCIAVSLAAAAAAFSTDAGAHGGLVLPGNAAAQRGGGAEMTLGEFKAPWFCHKIDCPVFKVLNAANATTAELWEEREYPSQEWTETYVSGMDLDKAERTGFMRLFSYISGANAEDAKVAMTAPVLNYITPGEGPFCEDHYNISFYVPYDLQGKAPAPTSPDVYSVMKPAMRVFVTSFGGYETYAKLQGAAAGLAQRLRDHGESFDSEHFYFAGYDSPFRVIDRHNEVWFVAK